MLRNSLAENEFDYEGMPFDLMPRWLLWRERLVHGLLAGFTIVSVMGIGIIFVVFVYQTALFFREVPVWQFFLDTQWTPLFSTRKFGIRVLISATLLITAIALLVAIPLGTLAAIYLSEYAPVSLRRILKPVLEALAGVPTIVYGYFALQFVTPHLKTIIPNLSGFNALSAGLITGALILPFISSLSEDAIRNVPHVLREGAYAAGMTRHETLLNVVLPAALPGIIASYTLAASRALGETMIAAIAAGQNPRLTFNPFVPIESMTAFIVQVSLGDVPSDSLAFHTIFAVGLVLFLITLSLNYVGQWMIRRYSTTMATLFVPTAEVNPKWRSPSFSQRFPRAITATGLSLQNSLQSNGFQPRLKIRIWKNRIVIGLGLMASMVGIITFTLLIFGTFHDGFSRLDWQFFINFASRDADKAGILQALVGTLWLVMVPAILVIPVGIGAAIYLEEYLPRGRLSQFLELNIRNAAAIPSILYGVMGLALFVRRLEPWTGGRSLLSASLVMAMITLPLLIIAAQGAFRSVPDDLKQAGHAVGMTRSQMVWAIALPYALPNLLTGVLLALSRILGETSALLAIGALAFISFSPPLSLEGLQSPFTTLPTQIFFWSIRPQEAFQANAAAAIIVLGVMVLIVNAVAVLIRDFYRRHV